MMRSGRNSRTARATLACTFALAGVLALASCTEEIPTAPKGDAEQTDALERSKNLAIIHCIGDREQLTVSCGGDLQRAESKPGEPQIRQLILGNQGVYVEVKSTNANYNAGSGDFTFDATVRNRIQQAIGTTDGSTLDPEAVRVFFNSGPTVTGGTGVITVPTPDGTATFTAPNQPYYQYNEVLSQFELSPAKQWKLNMPSTVTTFTFTVLVNADVQFPDGYIEVQPGIFSIAPGAQKQASAIVRNALGEHVPEAAVTWGTSDPNVAAVDAGTGLVTGASSGTATITATSGARTGTGTFNVHGIQRAWNGNVDTDWNNPSNWDAVGLMPTQYVPTSEDTAVVPGDRPNYPIFTSNNTVGGVVMTDGASVEPGITIGSFDFTLTSSIDHGPTGTITGPTGRMIFTGAAKTISGGLANVDYPHARFFGTYSLNTNLNITGGRLVVQGGRLRNASFRVRVRP